MCIKYFAHISTCILSVHICTLPGIVHDYISMGVLDTSTYGKHSHSAREVHLIHLMFVNDAP